MDTSKDVSSDGSPWSLSILLSNAIDSLINLYTEKTSFTPEADKELTELYHYLSKVIDSAKKQAGLAKKPLLILIGEDHFGMNSLIMESLIIDILVNKLSIKEVLTESQIIGFYGTLASRTDTYVSPPVFIQKKLNSMGIAKTPIDIPRSFWKYIPPMDLLLSIFDILGKPFGIESGLLSEIGYRVSKEGMRDRNTHMASVSIGTELNDKGNIVGAYHLFGLINETPLSDHYYVLPINTCRTDFEVMPGFTNEHEFYKNPEEVVQIHAKTLDRTWTPSFMTHNMLIHRLNTLHERECNREINPPHKF